MKQRDEAPISNDIPTPPLLPNVLPKPVGTATDLMLDIKGVMALCAKTMLDTDKGRTEVGNGCAK